MSKKIIIKNPKNVLNEPTVTIDQWVDNKERMCRFTLDIPIELHTRLKMQAASSGKKMRDILIEALQEKLKT